MKRFVSIVVLFCLVFGAAFGFVSAQDEMMTHTCDSTLILLLYLAEHDYGYHSEMLDLASYEKGQYAPLFDEMMAMMDDEMMEEDEMMDESSEEMMEEDEMMDDMVMLPVGNIEGEDEACTALREELDKFFYDTLTGMMMEEDMGE